MAANPSPAEQGDEALTMHSMIKEIQGLKDKFKDEDVEEPSPFQVLILNFSFSLFTRSSRNQPLFVPIVVSPFLRLEPSHGFFRSLCFLVLASCRTCKRLRCFKSAVASATKKW